MSNSNPFLNLPVPIFSTILFELKKEKRTIKWNGKACTPLKLFFFTSKDIRVKFDRIFLQHLIIVYPQFPTNFDSEAYKHLKITGHCLSIPKELETLDLSENPKRTTFKLLQSCPQTQLTSLKIDASFNLPFGNHLPKSLTELHSGKKFNQKIEKRDLPSSLTHLEFGDDFNQTLDNLSDNLKFIKLGNKFNQEINKLPQKLEILILGKKFDQKVDNLPNSLRHLKLSDNFNHPINNLPNDLKNLQLGKRFSQPIEKLPTSLTSLQFGATFNQAIDQILPRSLTYLELGFNFDHNINGILPENLTVLVLSNFPPNTIITSLPSSLERILVSDPYLETNQTQSIIDTKYKSLVRRKDQEDKFSNQIPQLFLSKNDNSKNVNESQDDFNCNSIYQSTDDY